MRISDWSSDVCSSDLNPTAEDFGGEMLRPGEPGFDAARMVWNAMIDRRPALIARCNDVDDVIAAVSLAVARDLPIAIRGGGHNVAGHAVCDEGVMIDLSLMRGVTVDAEARVAVVERSEEHTSELQSLMRISYADFCFKKKKK